MLTNARICRGPPPRRCLSKRFCKTIRSETTNPCAPLSEAAKTAPFSAFSEIPVHPSQTHANSSKNSNLQARPEPHMRSRLLSEAGRVACCVNCELEAFQEFKMMRFLKELKFKEKNGSQQTAYRCMQHSLNTRADGSPQAKVSLLEHQQ